MKKDKGPTDNAIRMFKDTWDEVHRYKKIHKRERIRAREALARLKKMKIEDIREEEE